MDESEDGWGDESPKGYFDDILPKEEEEGKKGAIANLRIGSRSNI